MKDKVIWYISKYSSPKKYHMGSRHYSYSKVWNKNGNDSIVFTSNSSHRILNLPKFKKLSYLELNEGVKTVWLNGFGIIGSGGISRFISWVIFELVLLSIDKRKYGKPDVVIASSLSLISVWTSWYLSRKHKSKFVFEVRDVWPKSIEVLKNYKPYNPLIQFLRLTERFGYEKADIIVGTMPNLKERVMEVNPELSEKVYCVPQCYDEDFYESEQEELDPDYVLKYMKSDLFTIGYAGTLSENNPLEELFQIGVENRDIRILIAGYGKLLSVYKNRFSQFDNIIFVPKVKKSQVQNLLGYVDVCYDSIDSELAKYGLSRNKWIDYMMAGKPIICSMDGYRSMINEADCGYFVSPQNDSELSEKINVLKSDSSLCKRLGRNGYEWILKERSATVIANYYSKLLC